MAARWPGPSLACSVRICPGDWPRVPAAIYATLAWPDCRHGLQEMADLGAGHQGREVGRFSSRSVIRLSPIPARQPDMDGDLVAVRLLTPAPEPPTCSLCSAGGPARISRHATAGVDPDQGACPAAGAAHAVSQRPRLYCRAMSVNA